MTAPSPAVAALERLAAALGAGEFATALVTGTGRPPRLTVVSRHTYAAEEICADARCFWWGWGEQIAAAGDPLTAAHKVATTLRAAPQPAHDW